MRTGPVTSWLLRNPWTKLLTRTYLLTNAIQQYKKAAFDPNYELWQAGKGVDAIDAVESCAEVLSRFGEVVREP